jgi:hypothetical protein
MTMKKLMERKKTPKLHRLSLILETIIASYPRLLKKANLRGKDLEMIRRVMMTNPALDVEERHIRTAKSGLLKDTSSSIHIRTLS